MGIPAHGALYYVQLDPAGSPNTFTEVTELNDDVRGYNLNVTATEDTPHNYNIDSYTFGVPRRGTWSLSVNYDASDEVHEGLMDHAHNRTRFGVKFVGVQGDWVLASGGITTYEQTNPVQDGSRGATIEFQPSGPFWVDGVLVGA
jgi:hypothetical protein